MKVVFLHGLNSNPNGVKFEALTKAGFEVISPDLNVPFRIAVETAQEVINSEKPDVIVGSSRGGAIAMAVNAQGASRVLIAPAWKKYGVSKEIGPAIVLHSETDDIVPFLDTQELFRSNLGVNVVACEDNHRMRKEETLSQIISSVRESKK